MVDELCMCDNCSSPWSGKTCNTCQKRSCSCPSAVLNMTSCECQGKHFNDKSGCLLDPQQCGTGSINGDLCQCECDWPQTVDADGTCTGCAITASDCKHGIFDAASCSCPAGFDTEPAKCNNGGKLVPLQGNEGNNASKCKCKAPWTGKSCSQCSLTAASCGNGGSVDEKNCRCKCVEPWTGSKSCTICPQTRADQCGNGELDQNTCTCKCEMPWGGKSCEKCALTDDQCEHGHADTSSCQCRCNDGYAGKYCNECVKDSTFCLNNGTIDTATCQCENCPQPWTGLRCGICKYQKPGVADPCVHGKIDEQTCKMC